MKPNTEEQSETVLCLKEKGNAAFKTGDYATACSLYSQALAEGDVKNTQHTAVLYKNRAACNLKLEKYEECISDATKSLSLTPSDTKSLFRRCQALEAMGDLQGAMADAKTLHRLDPSNNAVSQQLRNLNSKLQTKASKLQTTAGMISEMVSVLMDVSSPAEKRATAMKNLTIYAHQPAGADIIFQQKYLQQLKQMVFKDTDKSHLVSFLKILHGLCERHFQRGIALSREITTTELFQLCVQNAGNVEVVQAVLAVQIELVTSMVSHLSKIHTLTPDDQEKWKKRLDNSKAIQKDLEALDLYDEIIKTFTSSLKSSSLPRQVCLSIVDAVIKLVDCHKAVSDSIVKSNGVQTLLEIASCKIIFQDETRRTPADLEKGENIRMHIAIALSKTYRHLQGEEKEQLKFKETCLAIISQLFLHANLAKRLEGLSAYSTLFQSMQDTGDSVVQGDVLQKVIDMCKSSDSVTQTLAVEVLAHASGDKEACKIIRSNGTDELQKLYMSPDKNLKLRSLVCLCKLSATTSGNVNDSVFDEDVAVKLYKSARSFLLDPIQKGKQRKWSLEALAYLSINAVVKDLLINDQDVLTAILELAKSGDYTVVYGVCSCLVNLTNSYDKPKQDPEMEKLAEFAKQPIPKLHEKDSESFVKQRIACLKKCGLISCLLELAKAESANSKEMVARVFHSVIDDPDSRGTVVQQGGYSALIPLSLNGTEVGKDMAAQCIAKIGITTNPSLAFPGQRCMEVVRPLIHLLSITKTGLQQFESLMALTNLAQVSEEVRKRIVKEKGLTAIEVLMFDENDLIKRAATECMCNMIMSDDVFALYKDKNPETERLKLMFLYCGEEPFELSRAASGAMAMLTTDKDICELITSISPWLDILKYLVVSENAELQYRGVYIVANLMDASKDIAEKLIESELFEALAAISRLEDEKTEKAKLAAVRALAAAVKWELIKPTGAER